MPIDRRLETLHEDGVNPGAGTPLNLFVLGATGRTGRHVTDQAIARGHRVTAMVRRYQSLTPHAKLKIVIGDPLNVDELAQVLPGHDAVISCLGQRSKADATLLQNAAAAMLNAITRSRVRRYLVVSQGLLFPSRNPIIPLLRLILARHVADSTAMEHLVRRSNIEWTIVRPPYLLDGGKQRGYHAEMNAAPEGAWSMQRADLATFLLDEAERRQHVRTIVGLASA